MILLALGSMRLWTVVTKIPVQNLPVKIEILSLTYRILLYGEADRTFEQI